MPFVLVPFSSVGALELPTLTLSFTLKDWHKF